jgi:hypothetical protein
VITVDLPISDPALGAAEYAQTVSKAIGPKTKPLLVAHSMAGLVIPLVAASRPSVDSSSPGRSCPRRA